MRSAIRAARGGPYPTAVLAAWLSLPPLYHRWAMTAGGETYLVAEERGRIVAYAALRGDELTAVFVRGDLSGAGLGAKLVRQIEARARWRDVDTLRVIAAEGAVGFYARLGFSGARRAWVALPGGARLPARRMRKAI
jgi:N-acetylglutamate synthase-like GNAT family acetyltransferase